MLPDFLPQLYLMIWEPRPGQEVVEEVLDAVVLLALGVLCGVACVIVKQNQGQHAKHKPEWPT